MTKTRRRLLAGLLSLFVVAMIANGPLMMSAWRHKKALDLVFAQYSSALVEKDFMRAYGCSSQAFRSATPYDVFVDHQAILNSSFGELKSIDQGETVVEGKGSPMTWAAVVHADLVYERGTAEFVYYFRYEDSGWKLLGYRRER